MNMNNICRFLFESALYLDLDPAQAFRALGADEDPATDSSAADADSDLNDCCQLLTCA